MRLLSRNQPFNIDGQQFQQIDRTKWVTDITGTEQTVNLVLNTIKAGVQKEAVTAELQLRSDQGFQYTSTGYFNLTKEYGITPSMVKTWKLL